MGAEFLAMILVVVYVGAVAVLFLFVVMMLDINFVSCAQGFLQYLPIGALIGAHPAGRAGAGRRAPGWWRTPEATIAASRPPPPAMTNTEALGQPLYTDYIYLFQAAGMILLVAMIGAIVLTLREREGVRRQDLRAGRARPRGRVRRGRKVKSQGGI
jgi:NADH-quinone oxidoreductase subunit J